MEYKVRPFAVKRIKKGCRLIKENMLESRLNAEQHEGDVIVLRDQSGKFVAKALVGHQHKGIAWVFTVDEAVMWDRAFVKNIIHQAVVRRLACEFEPETTAYRLFNGEGDGVGGVTLDWYDGYVQFNWYSNGVYQYRDWIIESLLDSTLSIVGMYETCRFRTVEHDWNVWHIWGEKASQPIAILENNIRYAVYLGDDWMTGIFLDQREVREFVRTQSMGVRMLNLFSYTGAFSVASAMGGADQTVSVDVAKRSLSRTEEQFELNDLSLDGANHRVRIMDVFDYLDYAVKKELQFDFVVCDPPSFARTKKRIFQVEKDYEAMAKLLFQITAPGGYCLMSTNHSGYSRDEFYTMLCKVGAEYSASLVQTFSLPIDFPTTADETSDYLKVCVFYVQGKEG